MARIRHTAADHQAVKSESVFVYLFPYFQGTFQHRDSGLVVLPCPQQEPQIVQSCRDFLRDSTAPIRAVIIRSDQWTVPPSRGPRACALSVL